MIFVSEELKLESRLEELKVFDALIDEDSNFFINILRLKKTEVPEFIGSYEKINEFFKEIATLLKYSKEPGDKLYRTALRKFKFSEVRGINLGFSKGRQGSGFGPKLSKQIIDDAYEIIKSGSDQPEIFHLVSLFEDNVGPDRLSDMIATLIYEDIKLYTKRIYSDLNVTTKEYPTLKFESEIVINPYKNCELLLLPIDILQELPIARSWDDVERVISENQLIRAQLNEIIGHEWRKLATSRKKQYMRDYIFMNPEILADLIKSYRESEIDEVDVNSNFEYYTSKLLKTMLTEFGPINLEMKDSFESAMEILNEFKLWVEMKKGYEVILNTSSRKEEKIVQSLIHASANYYCKFYNLDISPESNTGRGPVDFKISRGNDKTVIEIKLTSNEKCVHGFSVQIEEYAFSEETKNKIFVLVDNGKNSNRVKQVSEKYHERLGVGDNPATLFIIDAKPKKSASTYQP